MGACGCIHRANICLNSFTTMQSDVWGGSQSCIQAINIIIMASSYVCLCGSTLLCMSEKVIPLISKLQEIGLP